MPAGGEVHRSEVRRRRSTAILALSLSFSFPLSLNYFGCLLIPRLANESINFEHCSGCCCWFCCGWFHADSAVRQMFNGQCVCAGQQQLLLLAFCCFCCCFRVWMIYTTTSHFAAVSLFAHRHRRRSSFFLQRERHFAKTIGHHHLGRLSPVVAENQSIQFAAPLPFYASVHCVCA